LKRREKKKGLPLKDKKKEHKGRVGEKTRKVTERQRTGRKKEKRGEKTEKTGLICQGKKGLHQGEKKREKLGGVLSRCKKVSQTGTGGGNGPGGGGNIFSFEGGGKGHVRQEVSDGWWVGGIGKTQNSVQKPRSPCCLRQEIREEIEGVLLG